MQKISPQTKSFIILFALAVFGTYLCLALWPSSIKSPGEPAAVINYEVPNPAIMAPPPVPAVDTTGWKTYTNKNLHLSFLYNPSWKILPIKNITGFQVLQVDPGAKFYNIKIFISPKEFYGVESLPTKSETIGGQPALNVQNALYGITANNLYYTFDVGFSMSLVPEFDALVYSVKFE
jgi:hypothetical protein